MDKKKLKFYAKLVISALILVFLIYTIDLVSLIPAVKSLQITDFLILAVVWSFHLIPASLRWKTLLSAKGHKVKFVNLYKFYLSGLYFNNFLPTSVGGDVARAWLINHYVDDLKESISTIFLERVLGLAATLTLAIAMVPFVEINMMIKYGVFVVGGLICVFIFMIFNDTASRFIKRILRIIPIEKVQYKLNNLFDSIYLFKDSAKELFIAYLISLVYQAAFIFYFFVSSYLLGFQISFHYFFFFMPIIWIISMIPISFNALGVREGGMTFFFKQVGLAGGGGTLVSLLCRFVGITLSLFGGLFFILHKKEDKAKVKKESIKDAL